MCYCMERKAPFPHNLKCKKAFYVLNKKPNPINEFRYRQAKKDCPACFYLENNGT
jgi:hypothetical protein